MKNVLLALSLSTFSICSLSPLAFAEEGAIKSVITPHFEESVALETNPKLRQMVDLLGAPDNVTALKYPWGQTYGWAFQFNNAVKGNDAFAVVENSRIVNVFVKGKPLF